MTYGFVTLSCDVTYAVVTLCCDVTYGVVTLECDVIYGIVTLCSVVTPVCCGALGVLHRCTGTVPGASMAIVH